MRLEYAATRRGGGPMPAEALGMVRPGLMQLEWLGLTQAAQPAGIEVLGSTRPGLMQLEWSSLRQAQLPFRIEVLGSTRPGLMQIEWTGTSRTEFPAGLEFLASVRGEAPLQAEIAAAALIASLAETFADFVLSGTAQLGVTGSLAEAFANFVLAGQAGLSSHASLDETFANFLLNGRAAQCIVSLAETFGDLTLNGSVAVTSGVNGSLNASIANFLLFGAASSPACYAWQTPGAIGRLNLDQLVLAPIFARISEVARGFPIPLYLPKSGFPPFPIDGVFWIPEIPVLGIGDEPPLMTRRPVLDLRVSQCPPGLSPAQGDAVVVRGVVYTVADAAYDGDGLVKLTLREAG